MAYVNYYRAYFSNHLNESIVIDIQRKDGDPMWVVETLVRTATEFKINWEADGDGLYSPIVRKNLELVVNLSVVNTPTWSTFFDQVHDEWRILVTNDTQAIFTGFMLPDEGNVPFEDKPYDLTIRAVDGIGLLKNVALKKIDGTNFHGKFTLIEYIAACLYWTGIQLPIKIYCDIYESSMSDRGDAIEHDMFAQAKLDHRTFMKNAVEFVSCFEALEIIFREHFRMHQDYDLTTNQQVWCIDRIPQYQYTPAPIYYYTLYDYDGTNPVGYEDHETYAEVGKIKLIYKTNEVSRSGKFAVKKSRTRFNYISWPELPLNNKFGRGTLIPLLSGPNYTSWTIDDWDYGRYINQGAINNNLPAVPATTSKAYRKSTFNIFGIELSREVVLEGVPNPGVIALYGGLLIASTIPVNQGDKINVSFEHKTSFSNTGVQTVAMIFLKTAAGVKHWIRGVMNRESSPARWFIDTGPQVVQNDFITDRNVYGGVSISPPEVPADGDLYIGLWSNAPVGQQAYFKSFNVEYTPMVAGGFIPVKGDYWETEQNLNYIDVTDNEITISDSHPRAIKGNLLRNSGLVATTPTWYRYGLAESKHYKQLANLGRYNSEYRRFMRFQGTFTSTKYAPHSDVTQLQPISFRKTYRFVDLPEEPECVLVAPLTIDYKTGWATAVFEEIRRESETPITETLADFIFRVIAAINSTSESDWDSASGAPASGTVGFPPSAYIWSGIPNTIAVAINDADNMTATYTIGPAANSPSITDIYNADIGPYRFIQFTFGTDIAIGNTFIFSAYGHDVAITVEATTNGSNDGRQIGDSSIFNYIFE